MTLSVFLKPSYLVLSSRASISHSWQENTNEIFVAGIDMSYTQSLIALELPNLTLCVQMAYEQATMNKRQKCGGLKCTSIHASAYTLVRIILRCNDIKFLSCTVMCCIHMSSPTFLQWYNMYYTTPQCALFSVSLCYRTNLRCSRRPSSPVHRAGRGRPDSSDPSPDQTLPWRHWNGWRYCHSATS